MKTENDKLLLELLADAETDQDANAVLELWESGRPILTGKFILRSLEEVAEAFSVSLQAIKQWRSRAPPMPGAPGEWDLREIIQWRCNWIQQTDLAAAKRQQDFELGQILVESKRIELEEKKRTILDRNDVELWAAVALVELREGIMQIPEMLAASAPEDLRNFVRGETDRHCRDLLTATARRLEVDEIGKGEQQEE